MSKVMPGVLLVPLLLQRRWKACGGLVAGAVVMWLIPLLWTIPALGPVDGVMQNFRLTWTYLQELVLPSLGSGELEQGSTFMLANNSPVAVLHRLFGDGVQLRKTVWDQGDLGPLLFSLPTPLLKVFGMLIPLAMFVSGTWGAVRHRQRSIQVGMYGLLFMAASAANVLFWHYHLVGFALPFAAGMAVSEPGTTDRKLVWISLASIGGLALLPFLLFLELGVVQAQTPMMWGVPTLGILVGWVCLWAALWRAGRKSTSSENDHARDQTEEVDPSPQARAPDIESSAI
jgi:hypothetical protein